MIDVPEPEDPIITVLAATARNLSLPDDQPVIVGVADSNHFFMADRDEQPKRDMKAVKSQPIAAPFVAPGLLFTPLRTQHCG